MQHTKRPMISIEIIKGEFSVLQVNKLKQWTMIESSDAYFVPYMHVFNALQIKVLYIPIT